MAEQLYAILLPNAQGKTLAQPKIVGSILGSILSWSMISTWKLLDPTQSDTKPKPFQIEPKNDPWNSQKG